MRRIENNREGDDGMNKKLALMAVAAVLAVPGHAWAQAGNVQIYGRLHVGLDSYSATGATGGSAFDYKSRTRVFDSASRLGFYGSEDLGSGLKAVFLMESGVNVDTGGTTGQGGQPNSSTGTLSSRIGHVGLQGGWGLLTFGRSNVWWASGPADQIGVNRINVGNQALAGVFGRGMSVGVSRQSNTLQYTSPVFSGFNAQVSYSPGSEPAVAGANTDAKLWAATLQGQWGQFYAGYDWVKTWGATPAAGRQPANTGHKLRAGWAYQPGAIIGLVWDKSVVDNGGLTGIIGGLADPAATRLNQSAWGLNWEHLFGNIQALATWAKTANIGGCVTAGACNNTGATSIGVGARYLFSKRTAVYASYSKISNESNNNMDFVIAGMTSAAAPLSLGAASVGADPRIVAVGILHDF
jgi:predicted porin